MSLELIAISAFVVAILGALSQCINKSNIKKCHMCCIDSDCIDKNIDMEKELCRLQESIEKNKVKIDKLKIKRKNSNEPETPNSLISINSFEVITEV